MIVGLQKELREAGYCVSPNNIYALPGIDMYPIGPGVADVDSLQGVNVTNDSIRVYGWNNVTVAEFESVADFLHWCPRVSDGGQAAHPQNWD